MSGHHLAPADGRDRGAADAVGLVVMAAPMLAFAILVFFIGQGIDLNAQLRTAAEAGAQAAALERDAGSAETAARNAVTRMLDSTICRNPGVTVDYPTAAPAAAVDVAVVEVVVTCQEINEGAGAAGLDEGVVRSARAAATIDFFRADDRNRP